MLIVVDKVVVREGNLEQVIGYRIFDTDRYKVKTIKKEGYDKLIKNNVDKLEYIYKPLEKSVQKNKVKKRVESYLNVIDVTEIQSAIDRQGYYLRRKSDSLVIGMTEDGYGVYIGLSGSLVIYYVSRDELVNTEVYYYNKITHSMEKGILKNVKEKLLIIPDEVIERNDEVEAFVNKCKLINIGVIVTAKGELVNIVDSDTPFTRIPYEIKKVIGGLTLNNEVIVVDGLDLIVMYSIEIPNRVERIIIRECGLVDRLVIETARVLKEVRIENVKKTALNVSSGSFIGRIVLDNVEDVVDREFDSSLFTIENIEIKNCGMNVIWKVINVINKSRWSTELLIDTEGLSEGEIRELRQVVESGRKTGKYILK